MAYKEYTKLGSCSFIGHRNVEITEALKQKIRDVVEDLIVNHAVYNFLFGSKSKFNQVCHEVVSELKKKYNIKRIVYSCKGQVVIFESEKAKWEEFFKQQNFKTYIADVEDNVDFKTKLTAGKLSYIERNFAMIDASDFCVFYYNEQYLPKIITINKIFCRQPSSGTAKAYEYAIKKKKKIINIYKKVTPDGVER